MPSIVLVGVDPDLEIRSDVFGYPDTDTCTEQSKEHMHRPDCLSYTKPHARTPGDDDDRDEQDIADIWDEMMHEKIHVNEHCDRDRPTKRGKMSELQLEQMP